MKVQKQRQGSPINRLLFSSSLALTMAFTFQPVAANASWGGVDLNSGHPVEVGSIDLGLKGKSIGEAVADLKVIGAQMHHTEKLMQDALFQKRPAANQLTIQRVFSSQRAAYNRLQDFIASGIHVEQAVMNSEFGKDLKMKFVDLDTAARVDNLIASIAIGQTQASWWQNTKAIIGLDLREREVAGRMDRSKFIQYEMDGKLRILTNQRSEGYRNIGEYRIDKMKNHDRMSQSDALSFSVITEQDGVPLEMPVIQIEFSVWGQDNPTGYGKRVIRAEKIELTARDLAVRPKISPSKSARSTEKVDELIKERLKNAPQFGFDERMALYKRFDNDPTFRIRDIEHPRKTTSHPTTCEAIF